MKKLILAIRKYPCLWKVDCVDYKLPDTKEAAWNRVVQECGVSDVMAAKVIWKRLRDGHRQALKQKLIKRAKGLPIDNRRWKYEKLMEFLLPYYYNLKYIRKNRPITPISECSPNVSQLVPDNDNCSDPESYTTSPMRKRNKEDMKYVNMEYSASEEENCPKEKSAVNDQNIYVFSAVKTFFDSMSQMCEELPEHLQIRIQRSVFNTIMEAREENLKLRKNNHDDPLIFECKY